jgi:hypothetical protein
VRQTKRNGRESGERIRAVQFASLLSHGRFIPSHGFFRVERFFFFIRVERSPACGIDALARQAESSKQSKQARTHKRCAAKPAEQVPRRRQQGLCCVQRAGVCCTLRTVLFTHIYIAVIYYCFTRLAPGPLTRKPHGLLVASAHRNRWNWLLPASSSDATQVRDVYDTRWLHAVVVALRVAQRQLSGDCTNSRSQPATVRVGLCAAGTARVGRLAHLDLVQTHPVGVDAVLARCAGTAARAGKTWQARRASCHEARPDARSRTARRSRGTRPASHRRSAGTAPVTSPPATGA